MNASIDKLKAWRANPVQFVMEAYADYWKTVPYETRGPDPWQRDALMALSSNCQCKEPWKHPHKQIAAKACKGPGKTCYLAWAIQWFLALYPNAKGLATSITGDNLRDNLWAELSMWQKRSPFLQASFIWTAERYFQKDNPENWFISARTWSQSADASAQQNTLAGLHGDFTIVVLDESGDIPNSVFAAARASLAVGKKNLIIQCGNPTQTEGPLYDACTKDLKEWFVIEITGDPDDPKRSSRIDLKWARDEIETWGGRDNPFVMTNVLGKFPPTQSNKLLGVEAVVAAMKRSPSAIQLEGYPVVYGLDCARYGENKSVLCKRKGPLAKIVHEWRNLNSIELAFQVSRFLVNELPDALFVDAGGLGTGVVDQLNALGWEVIPVDGGGSPSDAKFANKRSECWWSMAQWVLKQGCLPQNEELRAQLIAPTHKYKILGKSTKFILESKDEMKKRGVSSPDVADSVSLTFAAPVAMKTGNKRQNNKREVKAEWDYNPISDDAQRAKSDYDVFKEEMY